MSTPVLSFMGPFAVTMNCSDVPVVFVPGLTLGPGEQAVMTAKAGLVGVMRADGSPRVFCVQALEAYDEELEAECERGFAEVAHR